MSAAEFPLFERHGIFHPLASPQPSFCGCQVFEMSRRWLPIFIDGSAPTLEDTIRNAEAQLDQTLSERQIALIVAFLNTLTGNFHGAPVATPR